MSFPSAIFPDTKEWGPRLWFILHTFAEQLGKQRQAKEKLLEYEEAIHMDLLLKNLYKILPCNNCKKHAKDFILQNPLNIKNIKGQQLRETVREWLWKFHLNASSNAAVTATAKTTKIENAVGLMTATASCSLEMLPEAPKKVAACSLEMLPELYKFDSTTPQKLQTAFRIVVEQQKLGIPYRLVVDQDLIIFRQRYYELFNILIIS
jgi:hypothetical protein